MEALTPPRITSVGVVVIGRNEGQRLRTCLRSVAACSEVVVYVDSGSTDGSQSAARAVGADVIDLDMSRPFTAARARNAGFRRLAELRPGFEAVQFIDGDCDMCADWIPHALDALSSNPRVGMVCGRLRERDRDGTIYNRLCDIEWNRPAGTIEACGGIVMVRREAFESVKGFNESLVAGEDPEFCFRARRAGWEVRRLPCEMALHDAAIATFHQWWIRMRRGGWSYAAGASLHGSWRGGYQVRSVLRALWWGGAMPLVTAGAIIAAFWRPVCLVVAVCALVACSVSLLRAFRWSRACGQPLGDALLYAFFCFLAKPAEASGVAQFWLQRAAGRTAKLIEYK